MTKPSRFADVRSKKVGQTPAAEPGGTGPVIAPQDRLHAKDLAAAEGCSLSTARRLMASGKLGPVRGRSPRDRWVERRAYLAFLQTV